MAPRAIFRPARRGAHRPVQFLCGALPGALRIAPFSLREPRRADGRRVARRGPSAATQERRPRLAPPRSPSRPRCPAGRSLAVDGGAVDGPRARSGAHASARRLRRRHRRGGVGRQCGGSGGRRAAGRSRAAPAPVTSSVSGKHATEARGGSGCIRPFWPPACPMRPRRGRGRPRCWIAMPRSGWACTGCLRSDPSPRRAVGRGVGPAHDLPG